MPPHRILSEGIEVEVHGGTVDRIEGIMKNRHFGVRVRVCTWYRSRPPVCLWPCWSRQVVVGLWVRPSQPASASLHTSPPLSCSSYSLTHTEIENWNLQTPLLGKHHHYTNTFFLNRREGEVREEREKGERRGREGARVWDTEREREIESERDEW